MHEYDWKDTSNTVVPEQRAIAIYMNDEGQVVIRERDGGICGEEDAFIVIARESVGPVIERLKQLADAQ